MSDTTKDTPDDTAGNGTEDAGRTFTQAELDKIVQSRLAKERAQFGDLNELRRKARAYDELAEASKSELQKAIERAEKAEAERDQLEAVSLRQAVAVEKGLDLKLAARLQGSTREELEADADELLAALKLSGPVSDGRPKEALRRVPVEGAEGRSGRVDMDEWMRRKAASE